MKVDDYVLIMKGYIDRLSQFDVQISNELQVNLILRSLTPQHEMFILNYNINQLNVNLVELLKGLCLQERVVHHLRKVERRTEKVRRKKSKKIND